MATLDVVGVGALNLDYVATASLMTDQERVLEVQRAGKVVADRDSPIEWGVEQVVDAPTMRAALDEIDVDTLEAAPGGSAFNAVHALARTGLGHRLGYVGVSGLALDGGLAAHDELDRLGIERSWVEVDSTGFGGICLSVMGQGERTLLIHPGANARMAGYLSDAVEGVVDYLSSARVIHVTSFLDDDTPVALGAVLAAVKRCNPGVVVVVDPGHVWCTQRTEDIDRIVALGDYVLLNDREFRELAGVGGVEAGTTAHRAAAERLLHRVTSPDATIVHKQADVVWLFRRTASGMVAESCRHTRVAEEQIEDSTGAGDVFAAGLLAALADPGPHQDVLTGIRLGMALARTSIQYAGVGGHGHFAGIAASHRPA